MRVRERVSEWERERVRERVCEGERECVCVGETESEREKVRDHLLPRLHVSERDS